MNRLLPLLLSATAIAVLSLADIVQADDAAKVKAIFVDPPREYSSGPL